MADKIKYKTQDSYDFDDSLDLPDFDSIDRPKHKNKRQVVGEVAWATMRGARETLFSAGTVEAAIRKGLPSAYGTGLDVANEAASSVRALYDTAAKEFRPTINQLKAVTKRTLPKIEDKLPKSLADKLRDFAQGDTNFGGGLNQDQMREQAVTMELGSIFQAQQIQQTARDAKDEQREYFKENLTQIRHKQSLGQIGAMRVGIERLVAYQDAVTANYQKKSLELQFRQYYATADLLATAKQQQMDLRTGLEAIAKNTALPEFVKLNNSERFKELLRNRFMDSVTNSRMFGGAESYVRKFAGNMTRNVKEKILSASSMTNMASDMAGMLHEQVGAMEDMGMSPTEEAGKILGGWLASSGLDKILPGIQQRFSKDGKIARGQEKLRYGLGNAGQLIDSHLKDDSKKWKFKVGGMNMNFGFLKRWLAENAPNIEEDVSMAKDGLNGLEKPSYFSGRTNKSITEIIPGLLSHIHQELRMARTGNTQAGLLTYDFEANTFKDSKVLGRELRESIIGKSGRETVNYRVRELLRFMQKEGMKMSAAQMRQISDTVTDMSLRRKDTDASKLVKPMTWGKGPEAQGIANMMRAFFHVDDDGKRANNHQAIFRQRNFSEKVNDITSGLQDPRMRLQSLVNAGQFDLLRKAGVLTKEGAIDRRVLLQDILGEPGEVDIGSDDPRAASRHARRQRRSEVMKAREALRDHLHNGAHTENTPSASDGKTIQDAITVLKEELRDGPLLHKTEEMATTLLRIEQAINNTAILMSTQYSPEQVKTAEAGITKHKRWWQQSVSGLLKSGVKGAGRLGKGALHEGFRVGRRLDKVMSFGVSTAWSTAKVFGQGLGKAADKFYGDIYVEGQKFAAMTAAKLKQGEYFDQATEKVIKSFKDIKGTVVDKAGNVVLDAADIKHAFLKSNKLEALSKLLGSGLRLGFDGVTGMIDRVGGIQGALIKGATKLVKGTIRALIPVADVYIKGDTEPTLFRWKFIKGQYFSKRTDKVLHHQKDIDGAVLDEQGNVCLSEDQISRGLVNKDGKDVFFTVGNISAFVLKHAYKLGSKALKAGGRVLSGISSTMSKIGGGALDALSSVFTGFSYQGKKNLEVNRSALQVQKEILALLKERLPGRKHVLGDMNGDGVRDGSYEDQLQHAQDKSKDKSDSEGLASAGGGLGLMGRGKAALGALGAFLTGRAGKGGTKGGDKPEDGENGDKKEGSSWMGDVATSALGGMAASRLGKFGKGILGAGRGLLGLGRGVMGLGVGGALTAARVGGALALRGAVGLGMGAIGLASTPVVLASIGLTAAYYGYKALTKKRLATLSTVRFAQYGFDNTQDDQVAPVFGLEDMLEPYVSIERGEAKIDDSKVNADDMLSLFGVKKNKMRDLQNWKFWFENRFKPVFLGHQAVLKNSFNGVRIRDVDSKLEGPDKLKYLEATTLSGVHYDYMTSPFPAIESLRMDENAVNNARDIARTILKKDALLDAGKKLDGTPMSTMDSIRTKLTRGVAAAAGLVGIKMDPVPEAVKGKVIDRDGKMIQQSAVLGSTYALLNKNQLDALQALRFKTYGLVEMDQDKVKALLQLEDVTAANVRYTKKEVLLSADAEKILDVVKGSFGVSGYKSPQGYRWMDWYQHRFLPAYLAYLQALYKATGKEDPVKAVQALMPGDQNAVANAVKSATGDQGSVWTVTDSPWDGYTLNTNPESVKGNLTAITELAKEKVYGQISKVASEEQKRIDIYKAQNLMKKGGGLTGFLNNIKQSLQNNTPFKSVNASGQGVMAAGDAMPGQVIQQPGNGTGGDINNVPMGGGAGWQNMKGTINGAAQMAGVDPKLMAGMAAIESDFNPNAKAGGTTGAAGLYQFVPETWTEVVKKYGTKYGIAVGTSPTDPRANSLLAAEYMKANIEALKKGLKRPITSTDVYLAHLLGPSGAIKFLNADPNAKGSDIMPAAAKSNYNLFNLNGKALTVGEIIQSITAKIVNHLRQAGVQDSDFGPGAGNVANPALGSTAVLQSKNGLVLKLNRDASTDSGTFGKLVLPDGTSFETLELPWRDNQAQKSCIPPGSYSCIIRPSTKFGQVYEVTNVKGRDGILIHAGNFAGDTSKGQKSDVNGCILLGMRRGEQNGQPIVSGSKDAMGLFSQKLNGQPFNLVIVGSVSDQSSTVATPNVTTNKTGMGAGLTAALTGSSQAPGAMGAASASVKQTTQAKGDSTTNGLPNNNPTGTVSSAPAGGSNYASNVASNSPVRVNDTFRGFNQNATPSSSEVMAQQKASRDNMNAGLDTTNKTLLEQLDVQKAILALIKQGVDNQMSMKSSDSKSDPAPVNAPAPSAGPAKAATRAPVSMRKQTA